MNACEWLQKAERALASARLLLADGDSEGACNRAYYAMFESAQAALSISGRMIPDEACRTYNGLITLFSLHLVKPGLIAVELGRSLNRVQEIRLLADYTGDAIDLKQAADAVAQAECFVRGMQEYVAKLDRHESG
ncbi:HEPN domain-containing protein [Methylomonas rosea]|uniref:HEPN domain-containing protein n=1 Tax=Methylomonas rosea TaxID=2952227 RepID=A0ABT1TWZ8_9GAMM|nr:HEPN domain-containing protein [Methylomonas sp. WSC-7]MCQ8118608.1 HEPN domain-containing protein [Methylomonas sp. WSC-7]